MSEAILTINAGSSSVKFAAFALDGAAAGGMTRLGQGQVSGIGRALHFEGHEPAAGKPATLRELPTPAGEEAQQRTALAAILDWLPERLGGVRVAAIGHRVVHGGREYAAPVRLTAEVLERLAALVPLAPLHQPHNLAAIHAVSALYPDLPQFACFDTAFHRGQPETARLFALPYAWFEAGIERYGFHGLSYEHVAARLPQVTGRRPSGRAVVAHLGSGASLCAMVDGQSRATTMGFTALDGLPMGTRCGQIDPGVLLYLLESEGFDTAGLGDLLYRESGLKGLSGIGPDMRDLEGGDSPGARRALDYFTDRVARGVAEMAAAIGGIDLLVFTAGIGEHSPRVRAAVLERLAFLGFRPDPAANAGHGPCITLAGTSPSAWMIATDEESRIAGHVLGLLRAGTPG